MRPLQFRAGAIVSLALLSLACMGAEPDRPQEKAPQLYRTVRNWGQFPDVQGIVWPAALFPAESTAVIVK